MNSNLAAFNSSSDIFSESKLLETLEFQIGQKLFGYYEINQIEPLQKTGSCLQRVGSGTRELSNAWIGLSASQPERIWVAFELGKTLGFWNRIL